MLWQIILNLVDLNKYVPNCAALIEIMLDQVKKIK